MIVRCGRCQSGFEVPGPGRYSCPACGTANQVGATAASVSPPEPPQTTPDIPSRRVSCPECGLSFIVGDVAVAPCPNCGASVTVQSDEGEDA